MTQIVYNPNYGFKKNSGDIAAWLGSVSGISDLIGLVTPKILTEIGSVTQSQVAVNTSSHAYSSFSASNYFNLAYDSDFDFASGFSISFWVNIGTITATQNVIHRQGVSGTGAGYAVQIDSSGVIVASITDGTNAIVTTSLTDINNYGWTFITVTWDAIDTQKIYINGILDTTDNSGSLVGSLANVTAVLRIGISTSLSNPVYHPISLARINGVILTERLIKSTYDSEKSIFKKDSRYAVNGEPYTISFNSKSIRRNSKFIKSTNNSIGGNRQVLFDREDIVLSITTSDLYAEYVFIMEMFLSSVGRGGTYSLDVYEENDPVIVYSDDDSYSSDRIGNSNYFNFSFEARQS